MTNKEFDDLIKQAITEHFDEYFLESEIDYTLLLGRNTTHTVVCRLLWRKKLPKKRSSICSPSLIPFISAT